MQIGVNVTTTIGGMTVTGNYPNTTITEVAQVATANIQTITNNSGTAQAIDISGVATPSVIYLRNLTVSGDSNSDDITIKLGASANTIGVCKMSAHPMEISYPTVPLYAICAGGAAKTAQLEVIAIG